MEISEFYWQLGLRLLFALFVIIRIEWFVRKNQSVELLLFISLLTVIGGINLLQQNLLLKLNGNFVYMIYGLGAMVVFEPEIYQLFRSAISRIAQTKKTENIRIIAELVSGAQILASTKTGALIAFECEDDLGKLSQSGTPINSDVKKELLTALFSKEALTHDGGVIIRNGRIAHCSVIFPLTFSLEIDKRFGTRHRAAIGLTESTDAICLIVSEEEGTISLARSGEIYYNLDAKTLERNLSEWLSLKSQKRFYPVHRLRTFTLKEPLPMLLRFSKSIPTTIYDLVFMLFWIFLTANILLVKNGALNRSILGNLFSSETFAQKPWHLIPVLLAFIHGYYLILTQEIHFDLQRNLFVKKSIFIVLPVWFTKRILNECMRVLIKRESHQAPIWSLFIEDKKGKKLNLDSAGFQNSLLASAKQIHEFLKIELINHS